MCQVSDRFFSAVRTLSGDGPIKQRLASAYKEHLEDLRDEQIPDSIRQKFDSLRQALTAVGPANGESAVHASVRKMSAVDAQRYTTSILLMLAELVRVKGNGERLAFVKPGRPAIAEESAIPGVIQLHNQAR
ncbi:hypothetical protein GPROT2_00158 [Gammaproteobacteria bacterium]|nr:hypothetical protein [Gammaproteobacteria bacterium]QOJ31985.1 MAG: hypothetical protein HRU81_07705 [Gammaproteobacteria bacterium]CAG0938117.1 hypothetical protein GPROT2_00158 [Gammaproteobacteria bacterium]